DVEEVLYPAMAVFQHANRVIESAVWFCAYLYRHLPALFLCLPPNLELEVAGRSGRQEPVTRLEIHEVWMLPLNRVVLERRSWVYRSSMAPRLRGFLSEHRREHAILHESP